MQSIQLNDLCDPKTGEIQPDKLDRFLNECAESIDATYSARPDMLVKIIHNGELLILSHEQADHILKDPTYNNESMSELKQSIERALKGDAHIIKQEIEVLTHMARNLLTRFEQDTQVNQMEVKRLKPMLHRCDSEATTLVSDCMTLSDHIETARAQNPIISEYETKVSQMLQCQEQADLKTAKKLASQLASEKKNYLYAIRSIQPDFQSLQYARLQLQKIKKRIISIQKYILAQKKDLLEEEIERLRSVTTTSQSHEEPSTEQAPSNDAAEKPQISSEEKIEQLMNKLDDKEKELSAFQTQAHFNERDEHSLNKVIDEIATNVLNLPEESDLSEAVEQQKKQRKSKPPKATPNAPAQQGTMRMVTRVVSER